MTAPRHSVSVAAAVVDDAGRLLVIQRRDNGRWELPGGVLELDETPLAGVCREVEEETGFRVRPERLTGIYKNMTLGVVALVFRASVVGGMARTSDESTSVDWWTEEQITTRMDEAYSARLLDALAHDTAPAVRVHDGVHLLAEPSPSGTPSGDDSSPAWESTST